jgi:hypothetical protein
MRNDVYFAPLSRATETRVLNFAVTGQVRCGATVVQTALCQHPQVWCHGDLLHPSDKVRKRVHELYFGPPQSPDGLAEYCVQEPDGRAGADARGNPERYLSTVVFTQALQGESALGTKLLYRDIKRSDLWEFIGESYRVGDFCLIHVVRNPLACFVSLKQAERSGVWRQEVGKPSARYHPVPIHLDLDEFVVYARDAEAGRRRLQDLCPDSLVIRYADLAHRPRVAMDAVARFLEIRSCHAATPSIRRLRNRSLRHRVCNFDKARDAAPHDVRQFFTTDLF